MKPPCGPCGPAGGIRPILAACLTLTSLFGGLASSGRADIFSHPNDLGWALEDLGTTAYTRFGDGSEAIRGIHAIQPYGDKIYLANGENLSLIHISEPTRPY